MTSPFFMSVDPMESIRPSFYPFTAPQLQQQSMPVQHTQNPKIVGTSVLGIKYKDGIVLAADNLGAMHSNTNVAANTIS
jgi:20S proteasome alpha/beta subunit